MTMTLLQLKLISCIQSTAFPVRNRLQNFSKLSATTPQTKSISGNIQLSE